MLEELISAVRTALSNECPLSFLMDWCSLLLCRVFCHIPPFGCLFSRRACWRAGSPAVGPAVHAEGFGSCCIWLGHRSIKATSLLMKAHFIQQSFVDSKAAVRAARHRARRGRVEVLSHDCWNHNILLHALKNPTIFPGGEFSGRCQNIRKCAQGSYSECYIWCW